jgi:hypothetical protein
MITYEINVICEGEECKKPFSQQTITGGPVRPEDAQEEIADLIKLEGWTVRDNKHYCKKCSNL